MAPLGFFSKKFSVSPSRPFLESLHLSSFSKPVEQWLARVVPAAAVLLAAAAAAAAAQRPSAAAARGSFFLREVATAAAE